MRIVDEVRQPLPHGVGDPAVDVVGRRAGRDAGERFTDHGNEPSGPVTQSVRRARGSSSTAAISNSMTSSCSTIPAASPVAVNAAAVLGAWSSTDRSSGGTSSVTGCASWRSRVYLAAAG